MEDKTIYIEKQANISIILMVCIVIMTVIFMNSGYHTEDESIMLYAMVCPIFTVLLGMYTFTYRGKQYIASRIMFFIFLALSLLCIAGLLYFIELGKAFSH